MAPPACNHLHRTSAMAASRTVYRDGQCTHRQPIRPVELERTVYVRLELLISRLRVPLKSSSTPNLPSLNLTPPLEDSNREVACVRLSRRRTGLHSEATQKQGVRHLDPDLWRPEHPLKSERSPLLHGPYSTLNLTSCEMTS